MSTENMRSIRNIETAISQQSPGKSPLKAADPLEDGAPEARPSRFMRAIRKIKEATLPVLVAGAIALSSACQGGMPSKYNQPWDAGPDTDSDTDTDVDTDTDSDSDTDTDTGTDTDTDTDTDTETDTGTTDTDTDTDTDTETDTGPSGEPDLLTFSTPSLGTFATTIATSDTGSCTFMAGEMMEIETSSGEFIVDGYPFGTFYVDEHSGSIMYFIGSGDGYATTSPCALFNGLNASSGVYLLQADDGKTYAFEGVDYPAGYFEADYAYDGTTRYIGIYNSTQFTTPNGLDTAWLVSDVDSLSVRESLGVSVNREGDDTLKAASDPASDNGAFMRLNATGDFAGGMVFDSSPSGMIIGDYVDSTVFLPIPGEKTLSWTEVSQTGSDRTFIVPASE